MKANELLTAKLKDGKITFGEAYISASKAADALGVNSRDVDFSEVASYDDEDIGERITLTDSEGDIPVGSLGDDGLLTVAEASEIVEAIQKELDRVETAQLIAKRQAWIDAFNAK